MKIIPLSQGKVARIDDEDFDRVSQFKWYYSNYGYAVRNIKVSDGRKTIQLLSRFILNATKTMWVDHRSMDKLDNRRANLRLVTPSESQCNRRALVTSKTGQKGVSPFEGRWRATISVRRRRFHLGLFGSVAEAALAYEQAALQLHGEFARIA